MQTRFRWFPRRDLSGLPSVWCVALLWLIAGLVGARNGLVAPPAIAAPASIVASAPSPERARHQLETLGFSLDPDVFVAALAQRYTPLIELFLAAGVELNGRDAQGRSALLVATVSDQWLLAERLLAAGADPQPADNRGRTALMAAILNRRPELALKLLDRGATPVARDEKGHSALHFAIMTQQQPLVERLLEVMELPADRCDDGEELLDHALATGSWPMAACILGRLPAQPRWHPTTVRWLLEAVAQGDRQRIQFLLSKHATAPVREGNKQPLLAYAYLAEDRSTFDLLLECGADPNCVLNTPAEPAFLALVPPSTVRQYLASEPGMTLLMLAAGLGRTEDLKTLLARGAKRGTATPSKYRLVALYFAAWAQSPESLQALLVNAPTPAQLRIEISLSAQRATLFKNGVRVLTTPISTGRPGFATPQGRFVVTDKHAVHRSTLYPAEMPFFMRLSCRAFGLHEGYAEVPYASHGCIRVPAGAARRLFQEVPVGTLVEIGP